jgi:hypothetical protein
MPQKTLPFPGAVFIILLVYLSISYTSLLLHQPYLNMAINEDNFFEIVGSLGLFITSVLFFMASRRSRSPEHRASNPPLKQLSYLVLALLFMFGAGEEISWGQRIFAIETPEMLQNGNVQDEINIHNLTIFEGEGSLVTVDTLFTTFAFTFTLLIPLVATRYKTFGRFINRLMPVPHWSLGLLFLANFMLAKAAKVLFVSSYENPTIPFQQGIQEIKEGNYAVLFVLVAIYITFITLNRRSTNNGSLHT